MNNKYLRLFVALTKLMAAEKMRLDRYCQRGEYLAYKVALPPDPSVVIEHADDVKFVFDVELETTQYHFTDDAFDSDSFVLFEQHLSTYLNELFQRKTDFEQQNQMFRAVMKKIHSELTEEEQQCLATNIDANTPTVLKELGVITEEKF